MTEYEEMLREKAERSGDWLIRLGGGVGIIYFAFAVYLVPIKDQGVNLLFSWVIHGLLAFIIVVMFIFMSISWTRMFLKKHNLEEK